MQIDVLLGLQWGDEGKGKVVDFLAKDYQIVARFQGGPNAGHTLYVNGEKVVLHTVPSGIFHKHITNIIGNGVVINPITLRAEIEKLTSFGIDIPKQLLISKKATLIIPTHLALDAASEASKGTEKIGSTLRGIGPAYMDKTGRNGLRVGDILQADFKTQYQKLKEKHLKLLSFYQYNFDESLEQQWFEAIEFLKKQTIVDGEYFINNALAEGKRVLAEGAQGTMLDVDFGTYPFVTSSNTSTGGVCNGLGVPPQKVKNVLGVFKAYCTRVGSGPFPTELHDAVGEEIRTIGNEFGSTTGRPRRVGYIDLPALKYACMINGVTSLMMTKTDVLNSFDEIKICTAYKIQGKIQKEVPFDMVKETIEPVYETFAGWKTDLASYKKTNELPAALKKYIDFIEQETNVSVDIVSVGPGRDELVLK